MKRILGVLILLTAIACKGDERAAKPLVTDDQRKAEQKQPVAQPQPQPQPTGNSQALTGKTTDDRPKSLVGTIRGRGARTERMNEMRQIGLAYSSMANPPATAEELMNELKLQAPAIYQAMKDGYYVVNPRALKRRLPGDGIVVYEVEPDLNGQYVARASGAVDAIPPDQLKAELAK